MNPMANIVEEAPSIPKWGRLHDNSIIQRYDMQNWLHRVSGLAQG